MLRVSFGIFNCVDNSGATSGSAVAAHNFFGVRKSLRLVRLLAAGQNNLRKKTAKNNTYQSKFSILALYCVRNVDTYLHCKFRSGAWRPRADFPDSLVRFENAIDIDKGTLKTEKDGIIPL